VTIFLFFRANENRESNRGMTISLETRHISYIK